MKSESFISTILHIAHDAIIAIDQGQNIIVFNKGAERIFGYNTSEVIGQPLDILLPTALSEVHRIHVHKFAESATTARMMGERREISGRRKDGTIFPAEASIAKTTNVEGAVLTVILRDIMERKQAELALQEREQRLRDLVNAAPFGAHIYKLDSDRRIVFIEANHAADLILGVDHQQFVGKTIDEVFPATAGCDLSVMLQRVVSQNITFHNEQFTYSNGENSGVFEVHVVPIGSNRITVFFRDTTELSCAYNVALEGWSRTMDLRDEETEGHAQRVTAMAVRLADAMGLSEDEILHIRRGALLHDIGKMGVPDHILLKPGKLTDEEQMVMRKHPEYAHQILSPVAFLRSALDIPYCHHEKWDGTGYPRGLKGNQIPLAARIFAVVDVWDALRFDRPYRKAWPDEQVRAHIQTQAGTHFDAQVVQVFLSLISDQQPKSGAG